MINSTTIAASKNDTWLIVVNEQSSINQITQKQVMGLFLGRTSFLPTGTRAKPLDFPIKSNSRASFYQQLTGKDIAEIDAYWARLRYSGKSSPPQPLNSSDDIMNLVSNNKGIIAYLPAILENSLAEKGLKSILTIGLN